MYLEDYGLGFAWLKYRTKTLQEMSYIVSREMEVKDDCWRSTYIAISWNGKIIGSWSFTAKPGKYEMRRSVKNTYPELIKYLAELYEVNVSPGGCEYVIEGG